MHAQSLSQKPATRASVKHLTMHKGAERTASYSAQAQSIVSQGSPRRVCKQRQ